MKRKAIVSLVWLAVLVGAAFAFMLSQWPRLHVSRPARIVVARDVGDIIGIRPSKAEAGYDPYFHRINYFETVALLGTNASPGRK
jgi:hypothetical protein